MCLQQACAQLHTALEAVRLEEHQRTRQGDNEETAAAQAFHLLDGKVKQFRAFPPKGFSWSRFVNKDDALDVIKPWHKHINPMISRQAKSVCTSIEAALRAQEERGRPRQVSAGSAGVQDKKACHMSFCHPLCAALCENCLQPTMPRG